MKAFKGQRWLAMVLITLWVSGLMIPGTARLAVADNGGLAPLSSVPVPLPPNLGNFVVNNAAAIQLGKALFWDLQAGSDGAQACASCHFQAGADVRTTNTINPGANGLFDTLSGPGQPICLANFPVKTGDVVGSDGVLDTIFLGLSTPPGIIDLGTLLADPVFGNNRQCTGRNAPFAVNAVFNFRSFWDGRANNVFNGVTPFGPAGAESPTVYQIIGGVPAVVTVQIPNGSLASQACGPPLSPVEMSFAGRTFPQLGRKLLSLKPLGEQVVAPTDSVLGPLADSPNGLNVTYAQLIQAAFAPQWWNYPGTVTNGFTVMESNFSLFWGLSIMLYEASLVSDQTPLDQFLAGNTAALTPRQQTGLQVYIGKGRCSQCHGGAELTKASVSQTGGNAQTGFFNTGVRPLAEDGGDIAQPGQGKFKTPGLRNIALTGPYFHNGNQATLRQVVDFYDRGGDFPNQFTDSQVRPLLLTESEKMALVDLMAIGMTDPRVANESAPFDHPSMNVANGPSLPAVGKDGRTAIGLGPLQPFLGANHFLPISSTMPFLDLLL